MERMGGCSNGWALSLDDLDVSQLLPMRGVNFDLGVRRSRSIHHFPLFSRTFLRLHGQGAKDNTPWEKTSCFIIPRIRWTLSACISRDACCCRESRLITCAFALSVSWVTPRSHMPRRTQRRGKRLATKPKINPLIHDELPASLRSTISLRCSDKASHFTSATPFATVVWTHIYTLLVLHLICAFHILPVTIH